MDIFTQDKPIYLQICDRLCDEILAGQYYDDNRIPSVREYGTLLQVNANTAVKAYEQLSRDGIIYQRRGMGYFVTAGARDRIMEQRKEELLHSKLPNVFSDMSILGITIEDILSAYKEWSDDQAE